MKKTRLTFVATVVAVFGTFPLGSVAHACPDPDNPCDIQPYEVPGHTKIYCLLKGNC